MPETPPAPIPVTDLDTPGAVAAAVAALAKGELVVIPTDTVYGLAANAASATGVSQLHKARDGQGPQTQGAPTPSAWHAATTARLAEVVPLRSPLHRRLARVLLPGPVTLLIEATADELASVRTALSVPTGVIDDGRMVVARVPDHRSLRSLLQSAPFPIAAEGVWVSPTAAARTADAAADALRASAAPVASVLDGGESLGRPSTSIRLTADGGYRVVGAGVYDAPYIQRRVQRRILFVCTGNTCRSPMAEAIASSMIGRGPGEIPTVVQSAGLGAGQGAPPTPETVAAVEALGVRHAFGRSRPVTRSMIDEAEAVFAMTRSHLNGLRAMLPSAGAKVRLLDPEGEDLPDPIGTTQDNYSALARTMQAMIAQRLKELEP